MTSRKTSTKPGRQRATSTATRIPPRLPAEQRKELLALQHQLGPRPPWHKPRKSYRRIERHALARALRLATSAKPPGKSRPLSPLAHAFFAVLQLETRLSAVLQDCNYRRSLDFGFQRIHSANFLPFHNLEEFQNFLPEGLLQIGSCVNGDPVAVDLFTGSVGFLNHNEVLRDEPGCIGREHWFDTGLDLGTFLLAAVRSHAEMSDEGQPAFPIDFYQAGELGRRKVRAAARRLTDKR